ncbi:MAG: BMP family ABC transporter substrate-binding protein [Bacillota bacterium]
MKKTSRFLALLLVLAMLGGAFSGCAQVATEPDKTQEPAAPTEAAATEAPTPTDSAIDYSGIKIGVLMTATKEDGGWNQSFYNAFEQIKEQLKLSDEQVVYMEGISEASDAINTMNLLISDGCNMIYGTSAGYKDATTSVAAQYVGTEGVYFHQFEGVTAPNLGSFSIRHEAADFILGYLCAKMSPTDKLGFVAGFPVPTVISCIDAWASGARYANPNATVKLLWANHWRDTAKEKEAALSLLDEGITCIGYQGSTNAVAQAVTEKDGYTTGYHIDMYDYAPKAMLASFMWNWTPILLEQINSVVTGTWTNETRFYGIAEGAASTSELNADIIPADILTEAEAVKAKLVSGEIKVFETPVMDNKGNVQLESGEFSNEQLLSTMWLLDNVIGTIPGQE